VSSQVGLLQRMESEIDEFMLRRGVIVPRSDAKTYLTLTHEELERMSPDEAGVAGYELARYAFYLRSIINFYKRRMKICEGHIRQLVGDKLGRYPVYGREEKWIAAIADNDLARGWDAIRDKAERVLASIDEYPRDLQQMSRAMLELQQSRRQSHGKI
jgi:hypothetical protein